MKQFKILSLVSISMLSLADVSNSVIHMPNEVVCSIEEGFSKLSKGLVFFACEDNINNISGFKDLLEGISNLVSNVVTKSELSSSERKELCNRVNLANDEILRFIEHSIAKSQLRGESEKTTMVEGLKQIVSAVFSILMNPSTMKLYLVNLFSGIMKLVSAVFADGKVDKQDLDDLQGALADILSGKTTKAISLEEEEQLFF